VRKARKSYSPQGKVAILRRHLLDQVSVLHLFTEFQLQPTVCYRWLKQLFDNGAVALRRKLTAGKRYSSTRHPRSPENIGGSLMQGSRAEMDDFIDTGTVRQRTGQASHR
jgi:transposase